MDLETDIFKSEDAKRIAAWVNLNRREFDDAGADEPAYDAPRSGGGAPYKTGAPDRREPTVGMPGPATGVSLRPHEPESDKEIEREDVVKGYE